MKTGLVTRLCSVAFAFALALLHDSVARANTVTYDYNYEFSTGTTPTGPAPWIRAVFQDVTPGTVTLTLTTPDLSGSEFVSGWYFNLNPNLNVSSSYLNFSGASGGTFTPPTIQQQEDGYKADGDGKYDILLSFNTSGGASAQFTSGDTLTYTITGVGVDAGLTAADFLCLSTPAGGHGPFDSAAHVQGIGNGGSGWVEPSGGNSTPDGGATIVLLGSALLGLGLLRSDFLRRRISRH
jgi:hypothetical protein